MEHLAVSHSRTAEEGGQLVLRHGCAAAVDAYGDVAVAEELRTFLGEVDATAHLEHTRQVGAQFGAEFGFAFEIHGVDPGVEVEVAAEVAAGDEEGSVVVVDGVQHIVGIAVALFVDVVLQRVVGFGERVGEDVGVGGLVEVEAHTVNLLLLALGQL